MLAVVRVPMIEVLNKEGRPYRRPRLPAAFDRQHGWGQASTEGVGTATGSVLVWVRGTAAELDLIQNQSRSAVLAIAASDGDSNRMSTALLAGDLNTSRREFVAAYRAPAATEEQAVQSARGRARVLALVAAVGLFAAAGIIAHVLGWTTGMALGALASLHGDDFAGTALSALNGRTMTGTPSGGTWADDTGGGDLNAAGKAGRLTDIGVAYDSAMDAVDEQEVTCISGGGAGGGPASRRTGSTDYYFVRRGAAGTDDLKMFVVTSGTATQLGSSSSQFFDGSEVLGIYSFGDDHSGLFNGSAVIAAATDTTKPTGRAGIAQDTNATRTYDNWLVRVAAAAGKPLLMSMHHHGGVR